MFTLDTCSDYTLFNDEINSLISSARPYEFSDYGAASDYADEVEEAIREKLGDFDSSDCGADEDTLTALRDRLDEFADDMGRADDICDHMDISIVWDDDAVDFYRENQSECDDAISEYYGGPSGTPDETALQIMVRAANCGLYSIVRGAVYEWTSNLEDEIRSAVDEIDEVIYEIDNEYGDDI